MSKEKNKINSYTLKEKIEFMKLNETISAHQIDEKYDINRHTLCYWKKNLSKMKFIKNKRKRIGGGGRISISQRIEYQIIKWI